MFSLGLGLGLAVAAMPLLTFAQKAAPAPQALLKRVVTKTEKANFGVGGTVTVIGAPRGSVTVEGWNKNEVEVTAEIELEAETEADLALMAQVNGSAFDPSAVHLSILTLGMHDRDYMKKNWKKFPKRLLSMPWKVDYVVRVPWYSDLEVTTGKGALKISGVEGVMQLKAAETDADLQLTGGTIIATFGGGNVNVRLASRSWRGRNLNIQMATGNLNVALPPDFNGDIDAAILRAGEIQNSYAPLKERDRGKFTNKSIAGRAGGGGALLSFVLGDGIMKFSEQAGEK